MRNSAVRPGTSSRSVPTTGRQPRRFLLRVRAALRAAFERPAAPLVRTALRAAAEREDALRRFAAELACFEMALDDADERGSRLSAADMARERRRDTLFL